MGQYLSSPITEKETLAGESDRLLYGISSQQGWRKTQEDSHIAEELSKECFVFGVFDGHGGGEVAKFCANNLTAEIKKLEEFNKGDFETSLVQVFHRMDDLMRSTSGREQLQHLRKADQQEEKVEEEGPYDILRKVMALQRQVEAEHQSKASSPNQTELSIEEEFQAGCAAVVALLHQNSLYVANAGDSRAVLSRSKQAVPLSYDHKPSHVTERERIVAAGGFLSEIGGICRVNGNLNLSRAIGDLRYKTNQELEPAAQIITAEPDIERIVLTEQDEFFVLACDGIWDVMDNQSVVDFVHNGLQQKKSPTDIASDLLNRCLARDPRETRGIGCDNMTCCIVVFRHVYDLYLNGNGGDEKMEGSGEQ